MKDYYYLLGVERQASIEDIKKAYRKLAAKFHPDTNQGDLWFTERFKELQTAYETLSDPLSKSDYDQELLSQMEDTYSQGSLQIDEVQRREEMIYFKEEVLRRKQEELDSREAELHQQWEQMQLWYNKFAFTRKLYQQWQEFDSYFQQIKNSIPIGLSFSQSPFLSRLKRIISIKFVFMLIGFTMLGFVFFGFFKQTVQDKGEADFSPSVQTIDLKKVYQGTIGDYKAVFTLEWDETDSIIGSYYYARNHDEVYFIKGTNPQEGKIQLNGYQADKKISEMRLNKWLSDSSICWEGKMRNKSGIFMDVSICKDRSK